MPKACHGKKRQAKVLRQPHRKINNSEEKISGNSQINLNATSQNCAHLAESVTTQTIALDEYILMFALLLNSSFSSHFCCKLLTERITCERTKLEKFSGE